MNVASVCAEKKIPKSTSNKDEEVPQNTVSQAKMASRPPPHYLSSSSPTASLSHIPELSHLLPHSPHTLNPSQSSQPSLSSSSHTLPLFDGTRCIHFTAEHSLSVEYPLGHVTQYSHNLTFKSCKGFPRILRHTLFAHGFSEAKSTAAAASSIQWTLTPLHAEEVRCMESYQKINHFLRIQGITRKDRLCENVQRMQELKGLRHFDIIPKTFLLPGEWSQFENVYRKLGGTWIIKPVCLSRGRGIKLISNTSQISLKEPMVISQYVDDPLCINGLKFDLRLYVLVTSFDPLRVYLYEEGLGRFATVPYQKGSDDISNLSMHLTNYSFNKDSPNFISSSDPERDDYGSKWSSSAVFRHLREQGHDVDRLLMAIEDVIVKTIIAGEMSVSSTQRCQPYHGNCFELLGFDILIDKNLRPWVLEVNFSPSLKCDAPIDLKIKSKLVADVFSLVGVSVPTSTKNSRKNSKKNGRESLKNKTSPFSILPPSKLRFGSKFEESTVLLLTKGEHRRRGGFVRIFPTHDTWDLYSGFLENRTKLNYMLHRNLYPENGRIRWPPSSVGTSVDMSKRLQTSVMPRKDRATHRSDSSGLYPTERVEAYVRKLSLGVPIPPFGGADLCDECQNEVSSPSPPVNGFHLESIVSIYLKKLLIYISQTFSDEDCSGQQIDELLDLLIRFLKSAVGSLSSHTDVIVPETFLSQKIRYRMVIQQLKEFIPTYEKEIGYYKDEDKDSAMKETLENSDISDIEEMILNNYSSHPLFECLVELVKSKQSQFPVRIDPKPDLSKLQSAGGRKVPRSSRNKLRT